MARVHAASGRRHRRRHVRAHEPDAPQDTRRRRRAAQHAAAVPERDRDRRLPALPRRRGRCALGCVARAARRRRARARDRRRRLLRARDRRQGLELRRDLRPALPRRGCARRAARAAEPRRAGRSSQRRPSRSRSPPCYSLAAPWLADRAARDCGDRGRREARALVRTRSRSTRCSSARPSRTRQGSLEQANKLYSDAVDLEPENARTWYALGAFYFEHKYWRLAYDALNNSYTYDRFGPAARAVRPARPGARRRRSASAVRAR